jgi:hypothetical protein
MSYLTVELLFQQRSVAVLVSLLFVVHPINSTVVDYIASRADSQATLFLLLSFWLFCKSGWQVVVPSSRPSQASTPPTPQLTRTRLKILLYVGSTVAFVLALLSKELAIVFPLWLVVSLASLGLKTSRRTVVFWVILGLYGWLRLTVLNFPAASPGVPPPLGIRLFTTCKAFVQLLGLLFVPTPIHIEKSLPFSSGLFEPQTLFAVGILE